MSENAVRDSYRLKVIALDSRLEALIGVPRQSEVNVHNALFVGNVVVAGVALMAERITDAFLPSGSKSKEGGRAGVGVKRGRTFCRFGTPANRKVGGQAQAERQEQVLPDRLL